MKTASMLGERILELRRRNKSYREIADTLNVSKGTISYWLAENPESKLIKIALTKRNIERSRKRIRKVIAVMRKRWAMRHEEARNEARSQFETLLKNPLFVAGIMLYWGEGDSKPKNPLRISNTDPRMIALYARFVKDILKVPLEKIRMALILYPDLKDEECKKFWAKTADLPLKSFTKSQYIKGYHPTKRLAYGICQVIVCKQRDKIKMLEWIDLFYKKSTMSG